MKFCAFCGKELDKDSQFCSYCGKKQTNSIEIQKTTTSNKNLFLNKVIVPVFLGIILIGTVVVFLTYLNEKNLPVTENKTDIVLPEERVTYITQKIKEIKTIEEKRKEGYSLNEKPFESGDYSYNERTVDFRLVCSRPCPVSKQILDQEFAAIAYSVSTLKGLTQSNINPELLPFDVHASDDNRCISDPNRYLAYKTTYVDSNGNSRGLLCFFYDKINYDRSKFPYSTSVHEVTHLFEDGKYKRNSVIDEGLAEMLESFFLKGNEKNSFCWQGNAWYKQVLKNSDDPHWVGGDLFFELCNQYRFDYINLPELFRQLELKNGNVDEREFVNIINKIVGSDTSQLFRKAGVI